MARIKKKYSNGQPRFTELSMRKNKPKRYAEASGERRKSLEQSVKALRSMYGSPIKR
jgi:hypothetical protein